MDPRGGNAGPLNRLEILDPREALVERAVLVGMLVHLRVDDELNVHPVVDGLLERVDDRIVAKLVEAAQQAIAGLRVRDELQQRVVQVAAQPIERFLPLRGGCQKVRPLIAEAPLVRLTARDAAIEEHVVRRVREERLGAHLDRDRRRAAIDVLGLPLQGMKPVRVGVGGLGGEVVPDEALDRMIPGAHHHVLGRHRNHRPEHLEAVHEVLLAGRRIDALDREAQEPGGIRAGRFDGERDRVDAADRVDDVAVRRLRSKAHGRLLFRWTSKGWEPSRP